MNFEQALNLVVRHRSLSRARDAHYDRIKQNRSHRHQSIRNERENRWRAMHNQQRFAHQSQLSEQRRIADIQRDQFRADQDRMAQEQEEQRQVDQINQNIQAIEDHGSLSEEQKRDMTWRLRQKKMGLTPSSPPDQPNYPPEKGIGMTWMEETDEVWPPGHPNEGNPIRVWYTRDGREQVKVVRHEGDIWHTQQAENRKLDTEEKRVSQEERKQNLELWDKKSSESLEIIRDSPGTTPDQRDEIDYILEKREKEDTKLEDAEAKKREGEAKKADTARRKEIKEDAKRQAARQVRRERKEWDAGIDLDRELIKDEDAKEPRWPDREADLFDEIEGRMLEEYEAELEGDDVASQPVGQEVPMNPESGMYEIA